MGWIQDLFKPERREWEDFYRNRWQYDRIVRSTHGVNCTGGCSWEVYVKDGIIVWEMQQTDYPMLEDKLPPYEPRGCQRGISASWYVYSPIRVKYPYIRGPLLDFWREAKQQHENPVEAWRSIVEDESKRKRYQRARGKGGFRRASWDEALEIVAAACLYTAKKYGPDRLFSFSPIPAMSYLSYAAGSRFTQLFGGASMSFYDWYADLPNQFPETWGDQTDVCESADWYNSKFIVSVGANLNMTRTPDVHFISEGRYEGAKFVVVAPDFNQVAKYSDWWIPVKAGEDNAMWMAVNHVILKEFHADRTIDYFIDYLTRYSDGPFLVKLDTASDGSVKPGRLLTAGEIERYSGEEHNAWKFLIQDSLSGELRSPKGAVGHHWGSRKGRWNLKLEDSLDDSRIDPQLSFLNQCDEVMQVKIYDFAGKRYLLRGVPVRHVPTKDGPMPVATVYDLLFAHYGVSRGLPGDYPTSYDDTVPYTPAWQEPITGIGRETIIRFAREFAGNAEKTRGKSMVIIGASANHWYNNNLVYRGPSTALILCGCCGVNGGGLNHYVGQEKLTLAAAWKPVAFANDWLKPPRLQQTPLWHYIMSDQWRYEGEFTEYAPLPNDVKWAKGHAADHVARSVRLGWMPFYPQFNRNPIEVIREAEQAGAKSAEEIVQYVLDAIRTGTLELSVENPDAPENWPRVWLIWRGNAIQSSAKGHEFFLRHYLGTHHNLIAQERVNGTAKDVKATGKAPEGKMDLVVDINFRMDTSAVYSDIVLPTAFWYEKDDLNTTDLHSFIHNLGKAVDPPWEARSDFDIFKALAKRVSEMAGYAFDGPVKDLVAAPLSANCPDEMAQREVVDWKGQNDPLEPGRNFPHLKIVERDYSKLYQKFISFGRKVREDGLTGHNWGPIPIGKFYDELLEYPEGGSPDPRHKRTVSWGGQKYPSLETALDAANLILHLSPETNGEICYEGFKAKGELVGVELADMAEGHRSLRLNFGDLKRQPRRTLISPCWSGMTNDGRAYSAWTMMVERLVPWRTLTGRQHLYLDHPYFIDFGENLPTYKPKLDPVLIHDITESGQDERALLLNYITPHGKWNIHSTYKDNHRMLTLSRGMDPIWINDKDAARVGLKDNDWVEVYNDNGVVVTRANVSSRVQSGTCLYYHAVERTIYVPKSQLRGRRAGGHNSLTRTRVNPVQLAGGYGQWSYGFNSLGPIGIMTRNTYCLVRKMDKLQWD
ncbi:MAG: nitrate reductase subunit alpha [Candidatus Methylomirabilis oxygeniifera]|uniref:nitrate reductase (quinone) n=1 Tax=Methylomirabilis oxygeniifera TaxID=671143 RepID=D5MLH7_METO1|nr:MAG: nitrate reductase subunit alpha [Candidatus Methylomirabilis oxyfera]CBE67843.1 Nitrate reductase, alpha chain; may be more similar to a nitrite oxidoreductase [Candidatus Methylomirabilis oxyfera]